MWWKSKLTDRFTTPQWDYLFVGRSSVSVVEKTTDNSVAEIKGVVILKVTTNLSKQKYECYFTDGNIQTTVPIDTLLQQFPDLAVQLRERKVKF